MTEDWQFGDAAPQEPPAPARFPWPPAEDAPILASFGETWKGATFDPAAFFRRVPREGGTGAALLYYLALGILVAGASLFWETMAGLGGLGRDEVVVGEGLGALDPVVGFLLSPVLLVLGLFLTAGIFHVLLLLVGGAGASAGTSVRVVAYAYSPMIFGIVPVLGAMVGGIWMVVIAVIGLREAHGTQTWKAALAVLLPTVILLGLVAVAAVMMVAAAGIVG